MFGVWEQLFPDLILLRRRWRNRSVNLPSDLQLWRLTPPITDSFSLLLPSNPNLHSAAFGQFLPGCWGLLRFLLSPPLIQSQTITRRAAILPASGMSDKLADFTHSEVRRRAGIGSHDLDFCLLRLQKNTDAWKGWRIPLILGLRQLQVLHVVAFLCF